MLNHIRIGRACTQVNLIKWSIEENPRYDKGELQDDKNLLKYTNKPYIFQEKNDQLNILTNREINFIKYWSDIGIRAFSTTLKEEVM